MNRVDKKQLAFLKKQYFNSKQKTHCKKLEQQGGVFKFVIEGKSYKIYYKSTEAYTDFVFNSINLRKRFEETRKRAGLPDIQLGWDFRKTGYNVARREFKDSKLAGSLLGHTSERTGEEHYYIETKDDLRPVVKHLEKSYR